MKKLLVKLPRLFLLTTTLLFIAPINAAKAVDPSYQQDMARLTYMMGALYFLQPLCKKMENDWRVQAGELITLEKPTKDRKQRLVGAFNKGFLTYSLLYRSCTPSAKQAMINFLQEAQKSSRYIHTQFAE